MQFSTGLLARLLQPIRRINSDFSPFRSQCIIFPRSLRTRNTKIVVIFYTSRRFVKGKHYYYYYFRNETGDRRIRITNAQNKIDRIIWRFWEKRVRWRFTRLYIVKQWDLKTIFFFVLLQISMSPPPRLRNVLRFY